MTKKEQLELNLLELDIKLKEAELEKARIERAHEAANLKQTEISVEEEAMGLEIYKRDRAISQKRKESRVAYVTGVISEKTAAYFRGDFLSWEFEDQVDERGPLPVTVLINSPGGYVIPGLDIYDLIMEYRNKGWTINTKVTGMAMSMAGILLQAGEKRLMTPRSTFMLHEVATYAEGKLSDMKDQLKFTESLQLHCSKILAQRSHLSTDQVNELWSRKDVFLTAEETLEKGFIDRITL